MFFPECGYFKGRCLSVRIRQLAEKEEATPESCFKEPFYYKYSSGGGKFIEIKIFLE
jgi:hypothetical protein